MPRPLHAAAAIVMLVGALGAFGSSGSAAAPPFWVQHTEKYPGGISNGFRPG
jgi:hypothetical protein